MSIALRKMYKTNEKSEREGIRVVIGCNDDNTEIAFVIARMGGANREYAKVLEAETEPYRHLIRAQQLPDALDDEIDRRVFCKAALRGWENVRDENEQPLAFNVDNACKLFGELPELFRTLKSRALQFESFRDGALNADAKNS